MTASVTPFYSMNIAAGDALMQNLSVQMKSMQQAQTATNKKYTNWRAINEVKAPVVDTSGHDMVTTTLLTVLLDGLFGMGMFSALGETAHGLAEIGALEAHENHVRRQPQNPTLHRLQETNTGLHHAGTQTAQQTAQAKQIAQMKMLIALLTNMMAQQAEETKDGSGDDTLVPDALRDPKIARFKQNLHSISCVTTSFKRQMNDVFAPKFKGLHVA